MSLKHAFLQSSYSLFGGLMNETSCWKDVGVIYRRLAQVVLRNALEVMKVFGPRKSTKAKVNTAS